MERSQKDFLGALENYKLGLLPQAKLLLQSSVKGDPRHAEAYNLLGVVCYQRREFQESLQYLQRALALKPAEVNYYNNAGVTAHALGQYEAAQTYFRRALDLNPEYHDPYNNLGNLLKDLFRLFQPGPDPRTEGAPHRGHFLFAADHQDAAAAS
jgi:protein O-GlcNAc transferase